MLGVLSSGHPGIRSRFFRTRSARRDVALFSILTLVGGLAVLRPFWVLIALACTLVLAFCWWAGRQLRRYGLELWQVLVVIAISGYRVLNYGFENLTIHLGGIPFIVGYGLMFSALALAIFTHQQELRKALKEPAIICLIALIGLTFLHLAIDLPAYGLWAIRDSSICLDGFFILVGFIWGWQKNSAAFVAKWFLLLFIVNLFYSVTLPWGEKLWGWSPESGVFQTVPILGNYNGAGDVLAIGALFCICLDGSFVGRSRWLMLLLAGAQLLGIAIAQTRRTYLGLAVVLVLLVLLRETKQAIRLFSMLAAGIVMLFFLTAVVGIKISGRIGPVNLNFFGDHIRSISGAEDTPGSDIQSRFEMSDQAMEHFHAHPVLGEGFGQPLTSVIDMTNGAITRMPHNSSLTILARLGVVGFAIWIAFHLCLVARFVYVFRRRYSINPRLYEFIAWSYLVYLIFMITSLVEAPFEFPSGAIPFYFSIGFALGLIRWHFSMKESRALASKEFAPGPQLVIG